LQGPAAQVIVGRERSTGRLALMVSHNSAAAFIDGAPRRAACLSDLRITPVAPACPPPGNN
jgi:hypothetical protein